MQKTTTKITENNEIYFERTKYIKSLENREKIVIEMIMISSITSNGN